MIGLIVFKDAATRIYNQLPEFVKPPAKELYYSIADENSPEQIRAQFIETTFGSIEEYEQYAEEFEATDADEIVEKAENAYTERTSRGSMVMLDRETMTDYYALIRHLQPSIIVETGVCHGSSTLAILLAIGENEHGHLYSIDYPFRIDDSIEEFRSETYDDFGGAAIPPDEDPGWIVPGRLSDHWTLRIGKSQRELPKLLTEVGSHDLFIHDSEHSMPCMLFEYDLAWEWMDGGG